MMLHTPFDKPEFNPSANLDRAAQKAAAYAEHNNRVNTWPIHFKTDDNRADTYYSKELQDLVLQLLNRDPAQRLGQEAKGESEFILRHPAFTKSNILQQVENGTYNAPIKPAVYDFD